MGMIPWYSPRGETIAELMMRQGDIQAQAQRQQALLWGNAINQVGQIGAQAVERHQEQKQREKASAALESAFSTWDGEDPRALYRSLAPALGPEAAIKVTTGFASLTKSAQPDPKAVVGALAALPQEFVAKNWLEVKKRVGPIFGIDLPDEPTPEILQAIPALDAKLNGKGGQEGYTLTPGSKRFGPDNKMVAEVPVAPKEPASLDQALFAAQQAGNQQEVQRLLDLKAREAAATRAPRERDPVAAELAALRLEEARGKFDAQKAGKEALEKMGPEWTGVIGRATSSMPAARQGAWRETFTRAAQSGDKAELADSIKQAAIEGENVDVKNQVVGRMATIASLNDAKAILGEMKAAGVPTNWLSGNVEDLARKLGTTTNPQYVALGNRLMGTLINYRRAATGVQFGDKEAAQYERMFPNYRQTLPVNLALVDGLMREMKTYDKVYWEYKLGKKGAQLVGALPDESAETGTPKRPPKVPANFKWNPAVRRWQP
jgi:hypothetical protein